MIKLLHLADLHIGMENYGRVDPATGMHTRLLDYLARLDEAIDFALEEDVDMPSFLKRLDERGIAYRVRGQHTNGDAYVRNWASNGRAVPSTQRGA